MARIVCAPIGTRGDVNPFIAVSEVLRQRGHSVVFAVQGRHAATLAGLGYAVTTLPGDVERVLAPHSTVVYSGTQPSAVLTYLLRDDLLPNLGWSIAALGEACADADLLLHSPLQLAASAVADLQGLPWATIAPSPLSIPSPLLNIIPDGVRLPAAVRRGLNSAAWGVLRRTYRGQVDDAVNAVRHQWRLPSRRDLMYEGNRSPSCVVVVADPAFTARPADWPTHVKQTGFCFWDMPHNWQMPPALAAFLAAPGPVVAISFGSSAVIAEEMLPFYNLAVAGARLVGLRALVLGAAAEDIAVGSDVYALPFAPFSSVFEHCVAVVHHGGIGTIAQTLRAGLPMLIMPWGADQFWNGERVTALGVGRVLRRPGCGAAQIGAMLRSIVDEPRYAAQSRAMSQPIAANDGALAAATMVAAGFA